MAIGCRVADGERHFVFSVKKDAPTDELQVSSHVYNVTASVSMPFLFLQILPTAAFLFLHQN